MIRTLLARHLFYPTIERLCGRDSVGYARELQGSQNRSPDEIAHLQRNKLIALTRHAATQTTFYARRCVEAGIQTSEARDALDLSFWPVMTRDDIRRAGESLIAYNMRHALTTARTSGSTGAPLVFKLAARRRRADVASRLRCHAWFGVRPGDSTFYLWGTPLLRERWRRLKGLRDWLINERLLDAFDLSDNQLQVYARLFTRSRPEVVYSYASTLWRFAEYAAAHHPELRDTACHVAFCTGEELLPEWRDTIESALGCTVVEEYGTREGGMIAHQCPQGAFHIMAENVIVEILDDDDRRLPAGEEGRIVVTNLESEGMPFMRYDTGDRGALRAGACACGVGLPIMERPAGRAFEFLRTTSGVALSGRSLSRDIADIRGIAQYRITQLALDRVRVDVVEAADPADYVHDVRWTIRSRLGADVEVEIAAHGHLAPDPSGKWRYIINAIEMDHPLDGRKTSVCR